MKKVPIFHFFVLITILLIAGCRDETSSFGLKRDNFDLKLSWEEETVTQRTNSPESSGDAGLKYAMDMPVVERQKVTYGIYKNGTGVIEIQKMEPKNTFRVPNEALPNPDPQLKTLIFEDGVVKYYDDKGKLMQEHAVEMPDFKQLIDFIRDNKNRFDRSVYAAFFTNMQLKSADQNVEVVENDNYKIVQRVITDADGLGLEYSGKTMVAYYDKATEVLTRQALFDLDEKMIFQSTYLYSNDITVPIPITSKTTLYDRADPAAVEEISTITERENIEIINNL
jgi:hypothetical protein